MFVIVVLEKTAITWRLWDMKYLQFLIIVVHEHNAWDMKYNILNVIIIFHHFLKIKVLILHLYLRYLLNYFSSIGKYIP